MAIPVRRGRGFTVAEARSLTDRAVMINETMARRYWRDRDPINTQSATRQERRMSTAGTPLSGSSVRSVNVNYQPSRKIRCTCRSPRRVS